MKANLLQIAGALVLLVSILFALFSLDSAGGWVRRWLRLSSSAPAWRCSRRSSTRKMATSSDRPMNALHPARARLE